MTRNTASAPTTSLLCEHQKESSFLNAHQIASQANMLLSSDALRSSNKDRGAYLSQSEAVLAAAAPGLKAGFKGWKVLAEQICDCEDHKAPSLHGLP